jgi:ribosomal protein L11 methyltransferase
MVKSWIEVRVEVPDSLIEGVSNFLIEQGSPGVVQRKVPGRLGRKREEIVAYFSNDPSFPSRQNKIRTYISSLKTPRRRLFLHHHVIHEEKWAEAWKDNFRPLHATPGLVIKPPWEDYPERKGEIVIEIDPGMAFGTGAHPTTRMCLGTLEEFIPSFPFKPTILDVGTGSGILALAARKLGAGKTLAIDIDSTAVECARKNAAANQVIEEIDFRVCSPDSLRRKFDIVVANLLPQELLMLAPALSRRVNIRGRLIISGILRGQKGEITAAFIDRGLKVAGSRESEGWVCLVLSPRFPVRKEKGERPPAWS